MSDTTQELQEVLDEFEGSDFQVSPLDAPAKTETQTTETTAAAATTQNTETTETKKETASTEETQAEKTKSEEAAKTEVNDEVIIAKVGKGRFKSLSEIEAAIEKATQLEQKLQELEAQPKVTAKNSIAAMYDAWIDKTGVEDIKLFEKVKSADLDKLSSESPIDLLILKRQIDLKRVLSDGAIEGLKQKYQEQFGQHEMATETERELGAIELEEQVASVKKSLQEVVDSLQVIAPVNPQEASKKFYEAWGPQLNQISSDQTISVLNQKMDLEVEKGQQPVQVDFKFEFPKTTIEEVSKELGSYISMANLDPNNTEHQKNIKEYVRIRATQKHQAEIEQKKINLAIEKTNEYWANYYNNPVNSSKGVTQSGGAEKTGADKAFEMELD